MHANLQFQGKQNERRANQVSERVSAQKNVHFKADIRSRNGNNYTATTIAINGLTSTQLRFDVHVRNDEVKKRAFDLHFLLFRCGWLLLLFFSHLILSAATSTNAGMDQ